MATVDLEDKRLNERLTRLLSDLGDRPTASIPGACGGHKEMTAAYRFFDNPKVTYEKVLEPHGAATRQRMAEQPRVLLVQDTTEVDMTRPHQQVYGAGPLDGGSRRGALMHAMEAFTPDGTPLGAVSVRLWTRQDQTESRSAQEKEQRRRRLPMDEKESFRWLEGLRTARQIAQELPQTQGVCIADSEADIYELFAEPRGQPPVHWLIRAYLERCVEDPTDPGRQTIRDAVKAHPVLFTRSITVRGHDAKTSCETRTRRVTRRTRRTQVEVRAAGLTLCSPKRTGVVTLPPVAVNVVLASEVDRPKSEPEVEWLLVTTLPIDTIEQVQQIIHYYCVRSMIEVLFRTWKSGCRIEQRRFEHLERLLPCLALYWIIAWRVLLVSRLGRSCPELDCQAVFEPSEWRSVWKVTHSGPVPRRPPKLDLMVRLIAQLGGYINRPTRADPPGPQTLWIGLQRMQDLAWAWDMFGPGSRNQKDV